MLYLGVDSVRRGVEMFHNKITSDHVRGEKGGGRLKEILPARGIRLSKNFAKISTSNQWEFPCEYKKKYFH